MKTYTEKEFLINYYAGAFEALKMHGLNEALDGDSYIRTEAKIDIIGDMCNIEIKYIDKILVKEEEGITCKNAKITEFIDDINELVWETKKIGYPLHNKFKILKEMQLILNDLAEKIVPRIEKTNNNKKP